MTSRAVDMMPFAQEVLIYRTQDRDGHWKIVIADGHVAAWAMRMMGSCPEITIDGLDDPAKETIILWGPARLGQLLRSPDLQTLRARLAKMIGP